jgi:hypothetical protein
MSDSPYLSIVAVSRNDGHGGHLLERMQYFIDSLYEQCNRYRLDTELIIVEWNPPEDKKRLNEVLKWPGDNTYLKTRIIVVSPDLHSTFEHSDRLPLFQMIGKNVGIRRARGDFILATNIDILFSNELMEYLAEKRLRNDILYRADRMDSASPFNSWLQLFYKQSSSVILDFCKTNIIRVNKKYGTYAAGSITDRFKVFTRHHIQKMKDHYTGRIPFYGAIHTNGCGDFTLMSRALWMKFCGYPELQMFSWNIDSVLLIAAYHFGIKEIDLRPPKNTFHMEHGSGSGWTPGKGEEMLFKRIEEQKIPVLSWEDCISISRMWSRVGKLNHDVCFNEPGWGLEGYELEEKII